MPASGPYPSRSSSPPASAKRSFARIVCDALPQAAASAGQPRGSRSTSTSGGSARGGSLAYARWNGGPKSGAPPVDELVAHCERSVYARPPEPWKTPLTARKCGTARALTARHTRAGEAEGSSTKFGMTPAPTWRSCGRRCRRSTSGGGTRGCRCRVHPVTERGTPADGQAFLAASLRSRVTRLSYFFSLPCDGGLGGSAGGCWPVPLDAESPPALLALLDRTPRPPCFRCWTRTPRPPCVRRPDCR